jgi:ABC-2 type transport system ATP-binding protein
MTPLVETQGLTKRYATNLALDHLDLVVPEGAVYGFIGPNGAGKTTTMRILTGLLRPTSGQALVGGHDVQREPRVVRKLVGWMPDTFGVYDNMKSWEYLDFFAASYGLPETRRTQLIGELLDLVGLAHKRDDYVMGLSRGMKQRLSLARTMAHDPKLLILDEPASGLDPRARIELRELLKELGALGKTIMISSHILTELAEMCTHIGIIETGRLLVSGEVGDVLRSLQPHKIVQIRILGEVTHAAGILKALPGVRDVRLDGAMDTGERAELVADLPPAQMNGNGDSVGAAGGDAASLTVDFVGDDRSLSVLVRALTHADIAVIHFAEQASDLEDIFMQVTRGATQ